MKLILGEKTIEYPILRLTSENNIWEMGLYPVSLGISVSCGKTKSGERLNNGYCCRLSPSLVRKVFNSIAAILGTLEEEILQSKVRNILPYCNKPMDSKDELAKLEKIAQNCIDYQISHALEKMPILSLPETKALDELDAIAKDAESLAKARNDGQTFVFEQFW